MEKDNLTIKVKHLVNTNGQLNIDVFKNFDLPDNSKLILNCHGEEKDSIKLSNTPSF